MDNSGLLSMTTSITSSEQLLPPSFRQRAIDLAAGLKAHASSGNISRPHFDELCRLAAVPLTAVLGRAQDEIKPPWYRLAKYVASILRDEKAALIALELLRAPTPPEAPPVLNDVNFTGITYDQGVARRNCRLLACAIFQNIDDDLYGKGYTRTLDDHRKTFRPFTISGLEARTIQLIDELANGNERITDPMTWRKWRNISRTIFFSLAYHWRLVMHYRRTQTRQLNGQPCLKTANAFSQNGEHIFTELRTEIRVLPYFTPRKP